MTYTYRGFNIKLVRCPETNEQRYVVNGGDGYRGDFPTLTSASRYVDNVLTQED